MDADFYTEMLTHTQLVISELEHELFCLGGVRDQNTAAMYAGLMTALNLKKTELAAWEQLQRSAS